MRGNNMENEILEQKQIIDKTPKEKKQRIIKIISILIVFIGLITFAVLVFKSPVKVSFKAPGKLGFSIDAAIVDENGKINSPDSKLLEQKHYTFLGWYDNEEGKGKALDLDNMTFKESTTVYAIWDVIEYQINYDLDGGEITSNKVLPNFYTVSHDIICKSDEDHNNNEWHMTAVELEKYIQSPGLSLPTPVKENSKFLGWQIIYNGEIKSGITINTLRLDPIGNITLKALWQ